MRSGESSSVIAFGDEVIEVAGSAFAEVDLHVVAVGGVFVPEVVDGEAGRGGRLGITGREVARGTGGEAQDAAGRRRGLAQKL
jgi:hypothetical protein